MCSSESSNVWDACILAAGDLKMLIAICLLQWTVASKWVSCVTQKDTSNLHLAPKMGWISRTSQRTAQCLFQSRKWMTVAKLRGNLKGRSYPLKGTGYGFVFKSFAFNMFYPADLSFLISKLPCYGFIFLEKESCRDADLLLWFCCSHFKEKILKVISLNCWLTCGLAIAVQRVFYQIL